MAVCSECGFKLVGQYWKIERITKKFVYSQHEGEWLLCSRECAEKLMKRLEAQHRNVPYSSKRG